MSEHFEILIPISMKDEANNFMGVVGESMADLQSFFGVPQWRFAAEPEKLYFWAGMQDNFSFFAKISDPLVRPSYDTEDYLDITSAQGCLDNSTVYTTLPSSPPETAPTTMIIWRGEQTQTQPTFGMERVPPSDDD